MRGFMGAAALAAMLAVAACGGGGFTPDDACRLVKDHLAAKAGFQLHDPYRFPIVKYTNVEVIECFDFESDVQRGWARIHVRARGDEYEAEADKLLGRGVDFTPTFEFDRYDQGWKIVE
jgi:hypothetical protein